MQAASAITVSGPSKLGFASEVTSEAGASVTSLAAQATPLSDTFRFGAKRLAELAHLQQDWDSYGSPPLHPTAVAAASRVLAMAAMENTPLPFIGPVAGGGIQFEWNAGGRALEITLLPDGAVEYLAVDNGHEREARVDVEPDSTVRALVRWFVSPRR
jgi:hypothetical protein